MIPASHVPPDQAANPLIHTFDKCFCTRGSLHGKRHGRFSYCCSGLFCYCCAVLLLLQQAYSQVCQLQERLWPKLLAREPVDEVHCFGSLCFAVPSRDLLCEKEVRAAGKSLLYVFTAC